MQKSWWRKKDELDVDQKAFIKLPAKGKYSLIGPPGSGKTNLLLLRAQFIAGTGEKNVLILTYTNGLADFIRTGISTAGLITPDQVRTFHSWAGSHIFDHLGKQSAGGDGEDFDDATRASLVNLLQEANKKLATPKLYSAIFVDEAQDLMLEELEALLSLSDNVCICGDENQGIYDRDGLAVAAKLGLSPHVLKRHFRIGHRIAHVADRLLPPGDGIRPLEETSNYDPKEQGQSSAKLHPFESRQEQFDHMMQLIDVQLDAFKDEGIGIFCGSRDNLHELATRLRASKHADKVCFHGIDDGASFSDGKPIHLLTIHACKGTEFRAVHMFGIEDLRRFPLNRRRLGYTAITRAKTALNAYRTGETNKPLDAAFAEPKHIELDDLFPPE